MAPVSVTTRQAGVASATTSSRPVLAEQYSVSADASAAAAPAGSADSVPLAPWPFAIYPSRNAAARESASNWLPRRRRWRGQIDDEVIRFRRVTSPSDFFLFGDAPTSNEAVHFSPLGRPRRKLPLAALQTRGWESEEAQESAEVVEFRGNEDLEILGSRRREPRPNDGEMRVSAS